MKREKALAFRRKIEKAASTQTDEDALESIDLYPKWEDRLPKPGQQQGEKVEAGERLQDRGKLWKALQTHYVQADWRPGSAPALFTEVSVAEIPDWTQRTAENAFMRGEKCKHMGKVWESQIDNNTWEPGTIGTENLWHIV